MIDDCPKRAAQQARYRATRATLTEWGLWLAALWAAWTLLSRLPDVLMMEPSEPTPERYQAKAGRLPTVYVTVRREHPPGLARGERHED